MDLAHDKTNLSAHMNAVMNFRVVTQLVASRVVSISIELVFFIHEVGVENSPLTLRSFLGPCTSRG
jgi:hypothetical protein